MIKYNDFNLTENYARLKALKPFDIKSDLDEARIGDCCIKEAGSLVYNYGAMPVDGKIIDVLQALADEQQLIEKYKALLSGEVMNTGEKRLVLHQLTRGRVLEGQKVMADGDRDFWMSAQEAKDYGMVDEILVRKKK